MKQNVIFIDVDDTLIRSIGAKRIPMPSVIEKVRILHKENVQLYLWSSGGAKYAQETAIELSIENCFVAFLPKPEIYLEPVQDCHEPPLVVGGRSAATGVYWS